MYCNTDLEKNAIKRNGLRRPKSLEGRPVGQDYLAQEISRQKLTVIQTRMIGGLPWPFVADLR